VSLETVYVVRTRYVTDATQATSGLATLAIQAEKTGKHVDGLKGSLLGMGAALAGGLMLHEAKKVFVDFNAEVEQTKIQLAAMLQMNFGGSWDRAANSAQSLFLEFQRFSKLTPVTTKELTEFGAGVEAAVFQAGGSIKDFTKITEQGMIASKIFGADSKFAQIEITEMLQGNVRSNMRFINQMLGAMHITREQWKGMSAGKRLGSFEQFLDSDSMQAATKAFSTSFTGVVSTFKDNLQITLGQIGQPLFKALTAEVKSWNVWIEKNQETIKRFAESFSTGLVEGFSVLKGFASWVIDNSDTLIEIAKAFLIFKGASLVGSAVGGLAGTVAQMAKSFTAAGDALTAVNTAGYEVSTGLGGLTAALGGPQGAIAAVALFATVAFEVYDAIHNQLHKEDLAKEGDKEIGEIFHNSLTTLQETKQLEKERGNYRPGGMYGDNSAEAERWNSATQQINLNRSALDMYAKRAFGAFRERTGIDISKFQSFEEYQQAIVSKLTNTGTQGLWSGVKNAVGAGSGLGGKMFGTAESEGQNLAIAQELFRLHRDMSDFLDPEKTTPPPTIPENLKPPVIPANINVTIKEVKSEDPDRFVHMLTDVARRHLKTPVQTRRALRQG
jgi:hypothetical protein